MVHEGDRWCVKETEHNVPLYLLRDEGSLRSESVALHVRHLRMAVLPVP